jgi:hypothetical protein
MRRASRGRGAAEAAGGAPAAGWPPAAVFACPGAPAAVVPAGAGVAEEAGAPLVCGCVDDMAGLDFANGPAARPGGMA